MWLVTVLAWCLISGGSAQGPGDAGGAPSDKEVILNFDSDVYMCQDEQSLSFIDTSSLQAVRHNETTALLTGTFTFLKEVEGQFVIELFIYKEGNGRYEVAATELICDLCVEIAPKDEDNMYTPFLKFIKFPTECPITAGSYVVDDMIIDTSDFPINPSNIGRYQCAINFYSSTDETCKEKDYLGCIKLDLVIEPADK